MKSNITAGQPVIRRTSRVTPDGNVLFELMEDYVVSYGTHTETVPRGRLTDFASVPNRWRSFFSSRGVMSGASVKHDYDYFTGSVSKWTADSRYYEHAIACDGVKKMEALKMWLGVVLFGGKAWRRHRRMGHPHRNQGTF